MDISLKLKDIDVLELAKKLVINRSQPIILLTSTEICQSQRLGGYGLGLLRPRLLFFFIFDLVWLNSYGPYGTERHVRSFLFSS